MDNTEKQGKKGLSPKAKKIATIIVTALQVAVVLVTVVISIFVWTTTGRGDASGNKKFQMLAIRSNSMKGDNKDSFNTGDLVIIKAPKDADNLAEGTVITYKVEVSGGATTFFTHRILERVASESGNISYITKGDNAENVDAIPVKPGDIVGVYSGKLKGIGNVLLWLQGYKKGPSGWDYVGNTNNFLYVIIIPLIALLLWNGYSMIRIIMEGKLKKARDEAAAAAVAQSAAALDAEEIKRRAVEEYLASLNANSPDNPPFRAESPEQSEQRGLDFEGDLKMGVLESPEAQPDNPPLEKGSSIAADSGNGGFDNSEAQPDNPPDNSPEEQDPPDQPE